MADDGFETDYDTVKPAVVRFRPSEDGVFAGRFAEVVPVLLFAAVDGDGFRVALDEPGKFLGPGEEFSSVSFDACGGAGDAGGGIPFFGVGRVHGSWGFW